MATWAVEVRYPRPPYSDIVCWYHIEAVDSGHAQVGALERFWHDERWTKRDAKRPMKVILIAHKCEPEEE